MGVTAGEPPRVEAGVKAGLLDLVDGGYRKLAHRGSYEKLVWVSPSTLYRVLAAQGLVLPASLGYVTPDDEHQGRGDLLRSTSDTVSGTHRLMECSER